MLLANAKEFARPSIGFMQRGVYRTNTCVRYICLSILLRQGTISVCSEN